jgi:biotin synthase-like enzyme
LWWDFVLKESKISKRFLKWIYSSRKWNERNDDCNKIEKLNLK